MHYGSQYKQLICIASTFFPNVNLNLKRPELTGIHDVGKAVKEHLLKEDVKNQTTFNRNGSYVIMNFPGRFTLEVRCILE